MRATNDNLASARSPVESWRGAVASAPFPLLAHRTGRADLRHPALRLVSPWGTRQWSKVHASQAQHAKGTKDVVPVELSRAAALHLASSSEEVAHRVVDVVVDRTVSQQ